MNQAFDISRENMVNCQIKPAQVTSEALLAAMRVIPRERFVPRHLQRIAYLDEDVDLGNGRWLPEPRVIARLIQEAVILKTDIVLDIGCGTGYSTALLGHLASTVVGIEHDKALAQAADRLLHDLDVCNAVVVPTDDLRTGYPQQGPYNVILINGAVDAVPEEIKAQLAPDGRLLAVVSSGAIYGGAGTAVMVQRQGDGFVTRNLFDAALPPLTGFETRKAFVF